MSRAYLPGLTFLLLVFEGTFFQFLVPSPLEMDISLVPRFLIVMIVLIGVHFGREHSIVYGLVFGLVYDIVYTQLLGLYLFGFAFIGYVFVYPFKWIQDSFLMQVLLVVVSIAFFDFYQFGLYQAIGISVETSTQEFLNERLLPGLILNVVFMILIYYPLRKLFEHVRKQASLRER